MKYTFALIGVLFTIAAFAGQSSYIRIFNKTNQTITSKVVSEDCMTETNQLNVSIPPKTTSAPMYIENKGSGGCFFTTSKFSFEINATDGRSATLDYRSRGLNAYIKTNNYYFAAMTDYNFSANPWLITIKVYD